MLDWLVDWFKGLASQVVRMPVYWAAPMMILVGALDSSLLSLPEVNDDITVARIANHPAEVYFFPLFPAIGSVLGCLALYRIARQGGKFVTRRFKPEHFEWATDLYRKWGVLALAVSALLPPPMPFKIFVATAGVLQYPPARFAAVIMIARTIRYYFWGVLAYIFRDEVRAMIDWLQQHLLEMLGGMLVAFLLIMLIRRVIARIGGRAVKSKAQVSFTD